MSSTSYYNLEKPAITDAVDITVINGNMDTIDGAMHTTDSALSAVQTALSGIFNRLYPVGSIYITTTPNQNPYTLFGVGNSANSWSLIQGKFLLAAGSGQTSQSSGGADSVLISEAQMPIHHHTGLWWSSNTASTRCVHDSFAQAGGTKCRQLASTANNGGYNTTNYITGDAGGEEVEGVRTQSALSIMPPYYTVYVWERVDD